MKKEQKTIEQLEGLVRPAFDKWFEENWRGSHLRKDLAFEAFMVGAGAALAVHPAVSQLKIICDQCGAPWEQNHTCDDVEIIKPCPFCGSSAEMHDIDEGEHAGGSFIECTECGASTNLQFSLKDDGRPWLIERWNRRTDAVAIERSQTQQLQTDRNWTVEAGALATNSLPEALREIAAQPSRGVSSIPAQGVVNHGDRIKNLVEALEKWKCPACNGTKRYSGYSADAPDGQECRKCKHLNGLHYTAFTALATDRALAEGQQSSTLVEKKAVQPAGEREPHNYVSGFQTNCKASERAKKERE